MLYKYRSIENFKNFIDIILNNRLFAAPYFDLNDPMEGVYLYSQDEFPESIIEQIKDKKDNVRICSLSRTPTNTLMWSHYADGHKGVAIGLLVDEESYLVKSIKYIQTTDLKNHEMFTVTDAVLKVLSHKTEAWEYEEEERIFLNSQEFANVKIKEVILGSRMEEANKNLIKKLIRSINPEIVVKESDIKKIT